MHKCLFVFLLLTICICSTVFSRTNTVDFKDPSGTNWHRWIIVEEQDSSTVVLVTESPADDLDQRFVNQTIVDRTVFSNAHKDEIANKVNYFISLKDLASRTAQYYQDLQMEIHNKAPNPLWVPVKNSWTLDDENKYADWIKNTVTTTMTRGGGLEFDCADFGVLSRWIYAHDNKLPVGNTLAGSGKLMGHFSESKLWTPLPTNVDWKKDERFKAAMRFLFDSTYTHSIFGDLYPIKISKDFVTPGSIILTLRSGDTGHTQVVYSVGEQIYCSAECISVLYGNEPARDYAYVTQADIGIHVEKTGGFLRWRWPQFKGGRWQLTAKASMPGYSLEQYQHPDMSYDEFTNYIMESLGFKIPPFKKAMSISNSLYSDLYARVLNTSMGAIFCNYQYCDPAGKMYDDYSTPNKDRRFREKRDQLLRLLATLSQDEKDSVFANFNYPFMLNGTDLPTASDYIFNVDGISDRMSSDPSVSFAERWGLKNLTAIASTIIQFTLLNSVWASRLESVDTAIELCLPNGQVVCEPSSEEVRKLSTKDMDVSIRKVAKSILGFYSQLDAATKNAFDQNASYTYFGRGCGPLGDERCSGLDYVFSGKDYFSKMTSEPVDSYRKRLGLE